MISILAAGLLPGVVGFVLDASLKAAVLLLVATIATIVARRSSAAVRHRMWCLTFSSLVLLPVFCAALPRWNVAILPAQESRRPTLENANRAANLRTSNSPARNVDSEGSIRSLEVEGEPPTQTALTEVKAVASTGTSIERQTPDARAPQTGAAVWRALLSIWIVGASSSWFDRGSKSRPCAVWSGVAGEFPTTGGPNSWQSRRQNCGCGTPLLCCKRTRRSSR